MWRLSQIARVVLNVKRHWVWILGFWCFWYKFAIANKIKFPLTAKGMDWHHQIISMQHKWIPMILSQEGKMWDVGAKYVIDAWNKEVLSLCFTCMLERSVQVTFSTPQSMTNGLCIVSVRNIFPVSAPFLPVAGCWVSFTCLPSCFTQGRNWKPDTHKTPLTAL